MSGSSVRHSIVGKDDIQYELWLVFDARGSARMSRSQPNIKAGERGMRLSVTLPKALFKTPMMQATVTVPADPEIDPAGRITAEVRGLAEAALKEVFGVAVKLDVLPVT